MIRTVGLLFTLGRAVVPDEVRVLSPRGGRWRARVKRLAATAAARLAERRAVPEGLLEVDVQELRCVKQGAAVGR